MVTTDDQTLYHIPMQISGLYKAIRRSGLMFFPSPSTLQSYIGPTEGNIVFTDLVKNRLHMECQLLLPNQKHVSLRIEEVAIRPSLNYLRNTSQCVGQVDLGNLGELIEQEDEEQDEECRSGEDL